MTSADDWARALDDAWLTLEDLCRVGSVTPQWVADRVAEGLLPPAAGPATPPGGAGRAGDWRFDSLAVRRVRCMTRIERHYDAVPELAALVADLEDEIASLRARLRRFGLD